MIVVSANEGLLLVFAVWTLLWEMYEAFRDRARLAHKRHLS